MATRSRIRIDGAREDVRMSRRLGTSAAGWVEADRDPASCSTVAVWRSSSLGPRRPPSRPPPRSAATSPRASSDARPRRRPSRPGSAVRTAMERRSASRRLRAVVAVVTAAAVVGGVLTVVASNQRDEAQRQTVYRDGARAGRRFRVQPRRGSRAEHPARVARRGDDPFRRRLGPEGSRGSAPPGGGLLQARAIAGPSLVRLGEHQPGRNPGRDGPTSRSRKRGSRSG